METIAMKEYSRADLEQMGVEARLAMSQAIRQAISELREIESPTASQSFTLHCCESALETWKEYIAALTAL